LLNEFFIAGIASISIVFVSQPAIAADEFDVAERKCVQRGLLDAGFDPNGIDGAFGRGVEKAVAAYVKQESPKLPKLTKNTTVEWCRHFQAKIMAGEEKFLTGVYAGIWTSDQNGARCIRLEIDYAKGHLAYSGSCDPNTKTFLTNTRANRSALVSIDGSKIRFLTGTKNPIVFDGLDASATGLTGDWNPARGYRNMNMNLVKQN
jgi:hypothetical protein